MGCRRDCAEVECAVWFGKPASRNSFLDSKDHDQPQMNQVEAGATILGFHCRLTKAKGSQLNQTNSDDSMQSKASTKAASSLSRSSASALPKVSRTCVGTCLAI